MSGRPFFDTNIIFYAFRDEDARASVAKILLAEGGTISIQVLNEFVAVARRKLSRKWREIRQALEILQVLCPEPVPVTIQTHEQAMRIAERYGYSIYDALIVAAAIESGANILYSEDMHDGQVIGGVTIRNPFASSLPRA